MTWGICNDEYKIIDIDLTVLNKILDDIIFPQFSNDIKKIRAVEKMYTVTAMGFGGDVYNEVVAIEVSTKNINFNFAILIQQIDIIFKLLGLSPNDYKLRYRYK